MAEPTDHIEETPTADELKAFAKTDFYQGWKKRFDKLANLGATGVIATPNTTFDEWLYYFKQWSELYATDYQAFKDMADDAVRSLNDGYQQNKEDYQTMASDIQTGFENTSQTMKNIMQDVANLKNQVTNLQDATQPNANLKIGLIKETQDRIAGDNDLQKQINSTQTKITNTLSQIKLTPEYFESIDALKAAYPNGFNGLAVVGVGNVMKSYVWKNGAWAYLGVYNQTAINSKLYNHGETVDLDNLRNEYSVFSFLNNINPIPSDLENHRTYGAVVYTQTAAGDQTGKDFAGTQVLFSLYNEKFYMRTHWGDPAEWKAWENVTDKFFNNVYYGAQAPISLDDLSNGLYIIPDLTNVSPLPSITDTKSGAIVLTMLAPNTGDKSIAAGYQLLYEKKKDRLFIRVRWGYHAAWQIWRLAYQSNSFYMPNDAADLNKIESEYAIFSDTKNVTNLPNDWGDKVAGAIVDSKLIKISDSESYGTQFLINSASDKIYFRKKLGYPPYWHDWISLKNTEAPDYAWASISLFEKVGVIGDSYASGTIGAYKSDGSQDYPMHYSISWPQIMARKNGINVYNYSRGGATAGSWLSQTDERGAAQLDKDEAKDLYIINLGINDKIQAASEPLGSSDDIGTDNNSFYAKYAKIVKLVKDHAPKAKVICLGVVLSNYDHYDKAISEVANYYHVRYISTSDYALFTSRYFTDHMILGHPTAEVYSGMANAIQHLIEKDMTENHGYYYNAGF